MVPFFSSLFLLLVVTALNVRAHVAEGDNSEMSRKHLKISKNGTLFTSPTMQMVQRKLPNSCT